MLIVDIIDETLTLLANHKKFALCRRVASFKNDKRYFTKLAPVDMLEIRKELVRHFNGHDRDGE